MRAPKFWFTRPEAPTLRARLLTPIGWLYALAGRIRRWRARPYRAEAPVVCVGNLVAGGAGKTPTVLALCDRLAALGADPQILSRGYGGRIAGPHRVEPGRDRSEDVGDEPLLMAARWPVWIGRDRVKSAQAAIAAGAEVLVMDDGYQNPHLHKDLSIIVIDAGVGHGNERVIPAGPLREPLEKGFERAHAAILVGQRPPDRPWPWTPPRTPTLHARLSAVSDLPSLKGKRVVAFAGIGRPEKFFETLRGLGAELIEATPFPDHHRYSTAILSRLLARAEAAGAILATTEKDAIRLPPRFAGRVLVVRVSMGFADPGAVDALLRPVAEQARRRR